MAGGNLGLASTPPRDVLAVLTPCGPELVSERWVFPIDNRPIIDIDLDSGAGHDPVRARPHRAARWIAVAGGCGYAPVAPGTVGSLAGALLFLLIVHFAGPAGIGLGAFALALGLILSTVLLTLVGIWASGHAEMDFVRSGGTRDDGRIVIDEVAGQLWTLLPLAFLMDLVNSELSVLFPRVVTGFVLFRLFDVWKPGAIRWAERRFGGGLGVMADDVMAGVYGAISLTVLDLFVGRMVGRMLLHGDLS